MDQPGFGSRLPGTLAYKTSGGGSRLAKKIEIFGFNGLLTKPWRRGVGGRSASPPGATVAAKRWRRAPRKACNPRNQVDGRELDHGERRR